MARFTTKSVGDIKSVLEMMRLPKRSTSDSHRELNDEGELFAVIGDRDKTLMSNLSVPRGCTGHDNYLLGITVLLEVEAPHYWWNQAQRYHWFSIVSSSSKMHTLATTPVADICSRFVSKGTIYLINVLLEVYNNWSDYTRDDRWGILDNEDIHTMPKDKEEWFEMILDNLPMGYQLTAGISTNYLQLKNMFRQRKNHDLSHWNKDFVEYVKTLPESYLITGAK